MQMSAYLPPTHVNPGLGQGITNQSFQPLHQKCFSKPIGFNSTAFRCVLFLILDIDPSKKLKKVLFIYLLGRVQRIFRTYNAVFNLYTNSSTFSVPLFKRGSRRRKGSKTVTDRLQSVCSVFIGRTYSRSIVFHSENIHRMS